MPDHDRATVRAYTVPEPPETDDDEGTDEPPPHPPDSKPPAPVKDPDRRPEVEDPEPHPPQRVTLMES